MKINGIQTSNFLGARAVDVVLTKPVALFAGKNYAGKSSVQEAVRMALTGESVRVALKKDYAALISEGQETGFVEVGTVDGAYSVVLPSGKGNHCDKAALPYVLDAQRFASLPNNERRQFLFGLMGVKLDGAEVNARLTTRGCNAVKIEQVAPMLRIGFDAAAKEAAAKARDVKASYKTATGGDTWGKEKGGKWEPAALPDGADRAAAKVESITKSRDEANSALSAAQQELGAAKAEQERQHEAEAKRMQLHEQAGMVERIRVKLNRETDELAVWEEKVEVARAKAGVVAVNPKAPGEFLLRGLASVVHDMLSLDFDYPAELCNRAAVNLSEYRKLHGEPVPATQAEPDQEAITNLPKYEQALSLLQRAVANSKRDLEAAQQAAVTLKELDGLKTNVDTDAAQAKVTELTATRDAWQADLDKYKDIADKFARRKTLIEQVAKLHTDIIEWIAIADALAPDGIPSELLEEALDPINRRLFVQANDAQWPPVNVSAEMAITYGKRPYSLLSESEKWRADAMIAEAVSHISGIKLLVLDRFDVLDGQGREDALYWLDDMAAAGEIDSALLFGTLKGLPAQLPDSIESFWIENGTTNPLKEAA